MNTEGSHTSASTSLDRIGGAKYCVEKAAYLLTSMISNTGIQLEIEVMPVSVWKLGWVSHFPQTVTSFNGFCLSQLYFLSKEK